MSCFENVAAIAYNCNCDRKSSKVNGARHSSVGRAPSEPTSGQSALEVCRTQVQQLMERSEHLARVITHVCLCKGSAIAATNCPRDTSCCSSTTASESCAPLSRVQSRPFRRSLPSWSSFETPPIRDSDWRCCGDHSCRGSGAEPPVEAPLWGRSSPSSVGWRPSWKTFVIVILLVASLFTGVEGCSSRSTPKPRPHMTSSSPTLRPNVTFQEFMCPPTYAAWFCLNGATCFTFKIQELNEILYSCECAEGYMGQRCEYKDLDGSYLPARERVLQTASIASGACVAVVLAFVVLASLYAIVYSRERQWNKRRNLESAYDPEEASAPTVVSRDFVCSMPPSCEAESSQRQPGDAAVVVAVTSASAQNIFPVRSSVSVPPIPSGHWIQEVSLVVPNICSCEQRDSSGHVTCSTHAHKFIVHTNQHNHSKNVPKSV